MRAFLVLLCAAVSLGAAAPNFSAEDLRLPSFDSAGHLIRRLTAVSATGHLDAPLLEKGRVEFFNVRSGQSSAVLDFNQALYRSVAQRVTGDGTIKLTAREGTVSGRGYDCRLETGLLDLKSDVQLSSDQIRLSGDSGRINFDPKGQDEAGLIREAVVTGHVTFKRAAAFEAPFDRAETDVARYDAQQQKVFLKLPMTVWKNGEKGVMETSSGFFEIDLKEKPAASSEKP